MTEIMYGFLMIVLGIAITVGTIAMQLPIFIVSWGPVLFGIVRIWRGLKLLVTA